MHTSDHSETRFSRLTGVGGIGSGLFFELHGQHTLGRNESREGYLLDVRDYCKLHIVLHYVAVLLQLRIQEGSFQVLPLGKVGADTQGRALLAEMQDAGIDTRYIETITTRPTLMSICFQYPDGTGGNITSTNSAAAMLQKSDLQKIAHEIDHDPGRTIVLAVPEVPLDVRCELLLNATAAGAFRVASFTAGEMEEARRLDVFRHLDLLALNEEEAMSLIDIPSYDEYPDRFLQSCLAFVEEVSPDLKMVVSLGSRGAYGFFRGRWSYAPAPEVKVHSTAGAGDALLAGLIFALIANRPFIPDEHDEAQLGEISSALQFGVLLASYKVLSLHTIHPDASLQNLSILASTLGLTIHSDLDIAATTLPGIVTAKQYL